MSDILHDLFGIAGKTAVVTGGARGIGAMISRTLVAAGVDVLIIGRSEREGADFVAGLSGTGRATFLAHDLSSVEGVGAAAEDVRARAGEIHILVNNAGAFSAGPIEDADPARWDAEMALNLRAPFFLTQALLPSLRAAVRAGDPARVINIGSIGALWGKSSNGAYAYGATKAAIHQITKMMAADLTAGGITVNAIAPGYFPSDMTDGFFAAVPGLKEAVISTIPAGRLGSEQDMGGTVIYLASRAGAYVSGTILPLEGAAWQA
jgi:NAD(P)-dependent dehydrogenase (short-subunit alcohol dehydrogenase family)